MFSAVDVVVWVGAKDVIAGEMSGGQLAAFVFYAIVVAGALGALAEVYGLGVSSSDDEHRRWGRVRNYTYSSAADLDEFLDAIAEHPKLMERPIVLRGKNARLGRPTEAVLELFED